MTAVSDANGIATGVWTLFPDLPYQSLLASTGDLSRQIDALTVEPNTEVILWYLSANEGHTCGVGTVIGAPVMFCWGKNTSGQLGLPRQIPSRLTATGVLASREESRYIGPVSAGREDTCVVDRASDPADAVRCWGSNVRGQLGVADPMATVAILPGQNVRDLAAGAAHTCAVTSSGVVCWGANTFGQLGDGTTTDHSTASTVTIQAPPNDTAKRVTAGDDFSCALTFGAGGRAGTTYCWGRNDNGQLGDGTTTTRLTPVAVKGIPFADGRYGQNLASGADHSCALIGGDAPSISTGFRSSSPAYCWGKNDAGQLGDDTTISRTTAVPVAGGLLFNALAEGTGHTCGITQQFALYCWGSNASGQLGIGSTGGFYTTPQRIVGSTVFTSLVAGRSHACANLLCWGLNNDGQLGDGTTTSRNVPTRVVIGTQ